MLLHSDIAVWDCRRNEFRTEGKGLGVQRDTFSQGFRRKKIRMEQGVCRSCLLKQCFKESAIQWVLRICKGGGWKFDQRRSTITFNMDVLSIHFIFMFKNIKGWRCLRIWLLSDFSSPLKISMTSTATDLISVVTYSILIRERWLLVFFLILFKESCPNPPGLVMSDLLMGLLPYSPAVHSRFII